MATEAELQKKSVKKVITDGQHLETHSLKDQIEYEKYQASKTAAASGSFPLGQMRMAPPGTV